MADHLVRRHQTPPAHGRWLNLLEPRGNLSPVNVVNETAISHSPDPSKRACQFTGKLAGDVFWNFFLTGDSRETLEPITHFLTGACLGRAGFNRKTALATATMTLAAEAPDLDVFTRLRGPIYGFEHHRGFTHSFLGLFLVAAIVVGFMYLLWRVRGRPIKDPKLPPRWGLLFLFAYIAGLSHLLLDYTNNYGVRPFWPFWEKWYSWDIVFIAEPVMYLLFFGALVGPGLFGLINDEIGARQKGLKGRGAALAALAGVLLMYGVRDYEHRRALAAMSARTYQNAIPLRVSAYPVPINPFRWYGVAETRDFFALVPVDSRIPEVDPGGQMEIRYKPEETPETLAAKRSYLGRVYLDWAAYPITETEVLEPGGYIVEFEDLRFWYAGRVIPWLRRSGNKTLSAAVELNHSLQVVAEIFGKQRVPPEDDAPAH
jgi:inner membrane protein